MFWARQNSSYLRQTFLQLELPLHQEDKAFDSETKGLKSLKALGELRTERLQGGQRLYSVNWLVSLALPWHLNLARLGFALRPKAFSGSRWAWVALCLPLAGGRFCTCQPVCLEREAECSTADSASQEPRTF